MLRRKTVPALGLGIYTMADVSRYARIHYSTVRSWFRSRGVLDSDFVEVDGKFSASFFDLLDSMVAHQFRKHGVKMRVVRRAYEKLGPMLQTDHPFCHRDLYTDGNRIIVQVSGLVGESSLQDAISDQLFFAQIKGALDNVSYSAMTRLAERIDLAPNVEIYPKVAMGHPVIKGTGVTTYVVRSAYVANGKDRELVGSLYGLSGQQVDCAVEFEETSRAA